MVVFNMVEIILFDGYRQCKGSQMYDNMIYNISFRVNIFGIKMSICQLNQLYLYLLS